MWRQWTPCSNSWKTRSIRAGRRQRNPCHYRFARTASPSSPRAPPPPTAGGCRSLRRRCPGRRRARRRRRRRPPPRHRRRRARTTAVLTRRRTAVMQGRRRRRAAASGARLGAASLRTAALSTLWRWRYPRRAPPSAPSRAQWRRACGACSRCRLRPSRRRCSTTTAPSLFTCVSLFCSGGPCSETWTSSGPPPTPTSSIPRAPTSCGTRARACTACRSARAWRC
mmetsp:Transcript_22507/g.76097  ORF Transcript_22507/g.76097 Transcript_22507/m.76097 type:complete len:225 (-) Transcript_22507:469-1143(-)